MRDLLVILNPRVIDECMAAFKKLDIDLLWLRNYSEKGVEDRWPVLLDQYGDYDRWIIAGDDSICRQHAVDAVLALSDEGHPIVTGWSNLASEDMRSNLCKSPLRGDYPTTLSYDLYSCAEVFTWREPWLPTTLTGYTLAAASVDFWREYPFKVYGGEPGYGSDYHLSKRLEYDGIPIVAARDAFCWHVKERWSQTDQEPRKRLLVGIEPSGELHEERLPA